MLNKKAPVNIHPEGLTPPEEYLLDVLIDTKMESYVRRRRIHSDGSYDFYKGTRLTSPIDFAQHVDEHVFKAHESNPELPLAKLKINLRNLPPNVLDLIGQVMATKLPMLTPALCTGIPEAGVPLAKSYAKYARVHYISVLEKRETDTGRRVVGSTGVTGKGKAVLLIDDLITGGGSKEEAITAAEILEFSVSDVFVLIDRRQKKSKTTYTLHSVYTLDQILDYYLRTGKFTKKTYDAVKENLEAMQNVSS